MPYQAPEEKAKGARHGLRPKGTSDMVSEDAESHSAAKDDEEEEEEEESNPAPRGGMKKRAIGVKTGGSRVGGPELCV